ncbi:hypothetical protein OUZ56_023274 [Daphnia magna]|uniref:Uncharacterized protein n=1 Tax=Daphnia magna TaxID=35525 RepID=A0ABR0AYT7_9CRUS|nr:hypothetical protein OUZ56_023274 [Daphnia magna]
MIGVVPKLKEEQLTANKRDDLNNKPLIYCMCHTDFDYMVTIGKDWLINQNILVMISVLPSNVQL